MPETLIKVDLSKSAYDNDKIHNRWHPDIPMVSWVSPGDDFIIETYDWTGGFIKNNDSADDVRDIDLSIVHFLSGPIGVKGAEPGDLLVVDLLDYESSEDMRRTIHVCRREPDGTQRLIELSDDQVREVFEKIEVGIMHPSDVLLQEGLW